MARSKKRRGKSFRGFGYDPALISQGGGALHRAVVAARQGDCGNALEMLGKAKALLGGKTKSPAFRKSISIVEKGCPKRALVKVRADIADELMPANMTEQYIRRWAARKGGRIEPPKRRRVWEPGIGPVWTAPSDDERALYRELIERKLATEVGERHRHRRKGAAMKPLVWRRRGGANAPFKRRKSGKVTTVRRGRPGRRFKS